MNLTFCKICLCIYFKKFTLFVKALVFKTVSIYFLYGDTLHPPLFVNKFAIGAKSYKSLCKFPKKLSLVEEFVLLLLSDGLPVKTTYKDMFKAKYENNHL